MAKKFSNKDLFEPDFGQPLIDTFKALQKEIDVSIKGAKELGKSLKAEVSANQMQTAEDVKKLSKAKEKANKVVEEETKLQKQRKKVLEQLEEVQTEEFEALEKSRQELLKKKKEIRDSIKAQQKMNEETDAAVGSLKRNRLELSRLKKEYSEMSVGINATQEELDAMQTKINSLTDTVKEQEESIQVTSRSVGDYKNSIMEAIEETGGFSSALAGSIDQSGVLGQVLAKLDAIVQFLTASKQKLTGATQANTTAQGVNEAQTKRGARTFKLFGRQIQFSTKAFKVFNNTMKASVIVLIISVLASLAATLAKTQAGLDGLSGVMNSLSAIIEVLIGRLITYYKTLLTFGKAVVQSVIGIKEALTFNFEEAGKAFDRAGNLFSEGGQKFIGIFNGLGDAIAKAAKDGFDLAAAQSRIALENAKLNKQISEQLALSEKLEEVEGDTTRSFEERRKAIIESAQAQRRASELAIQVAQNNLDILNQELAISEEQRELTNSEKIRRIEAEQAVFEAKREFETKGLALRRTINQLEQDLIERNLDILIDGFDNQKTINEQLIQDSERVFAERKRILEDTEKLFTTSLNQQVREIQKTTEKQIDINDLLATSDAKRLNEKIRLLGLSEILEGRLLEVVRDARTAQRDLDQDAIDLEKQRIDQLKRTTESVEDLEADQIENKKEAAKEKLRIETQRAIDELEVIKSRYASEKEIVESINREIELLRKQLADDIEDIEKEEKEKQEEERKKELEKQRKFYQKALQDSKNFFTQREQDRRQSIEREIQDSKRREDQLTQLAAGGSEEAQRSLALEQQRQAELERERQRSLRRQRNTAFALAGAELIISEARSGSSNPSGDALEQLTNFTEGLEGVLSQLPAFEKGGKIKGNEQIIRTNEKGEEWVINHKAVEKYGDDMLDQINNGTFDAFNYVTTPSGAVFNTFNQPDFSELKKEFQSLRSEIKNKPVPSWSASEITKGLKETIIEGNKRTERHHARKRLF